MPNARSRGAKPHPFTDESRGERLQKVIAAAGFSSRRAAEGLIESGLVEVNGIKVETLPAWVDPAKDEIVVDGRNIKRATRRLYVMLFKPRGIITTLSDPEGRPTVMDIVQHPSGLRIYPVGRLDIDSSGLLLMTNDGELTDRLTHPRYEMHKGYEVTVAGSIADRDLRRIEGEIFLTEKRTDRSVRTQTGVLELIGRDRDRTTLYLELREGRNRQIRQLMLDVGHPVKKLRRVSMGPLRLRGVAPGEWRELTNTELTMLKREAMADPGKIAARRERSEKQAATKRRSALEQIAVDREEAAYEAKMRTAATAERKTAEATRPAAKASAAKPVPTALAPSRRKSARTDVQDVRRARELETKGIAKRTLGRPREIISWGTKPVRPLRDERVSRDDRPSRGDSRRGPPRGVRGDSRRGPPRGR
ncbi:MAG: pseudouridine synthase [Planctomycetota bacterium]|nr:pseudouridine synthase [Planctomycetota bacterium]